MQNTDIKVKYTGLSPDFKSNHEFQKNHEQLKQIKTGTKAD